MEVNANVYDEVSEPQFEEGVKFIRELSLSTGDKVLDMGCGTGNLSIFIADVVGPDGEVVGIDPDTERIKIAKEKYKEVSNLQFCVGSSSIGFPHSGDAYYDVHISTNAFHWVPDDEKFVYIQKAHQSLKSGGKLAILCTLKEPNGLDEIVPSFTSQTQQGYQDMFEKIRLFEGVVFDQKIRSYRLKSLAHFKRWYKATFYQDSDEFVVQKFLTFEDDGYVSFNVPSITIIGYKK